MLLWCWLSAGCGGCVGRQGWKRIISAGCCSQSIPWREQEQWLQYQISLMWFTWPFFLFFSLIKSAVLFVRTLLSFPWLHLSWQFQRDEQRGSVSAWGLFVTSLYFKMFCSGSECCQQLLYNPFLWRISHVVLSGLTSTRVWKGLVWWGWGWRQGADGTAAWAQPGGSEASWPQQPSLGTGTPAPAHSCSSATAANHKTGTFPALGKFVVVGSLLISPREMS